MQTQHPGHAKSFAALLIFGILTSGCADSTGPGNGEIRVAVSTLGATMDHDPDGYTLSIDGELERPVGAFGAVTFDGLSVGTHLVHLGGLASNCSVSGPNPLAVEVGGRSPMQVGFTVGCNLNAGSVHISAATSGSDVDPDGYFVSVAGFGAGGIPVNGSRDFYNVRAGAVEVELKGMSGNCVVDGGNPRSLVVSYGRITEVAFTVKCSTAGSIKLTMTTTGTFPDANGYQLEVRQQGTSTTWQFILPTNGTVTIPGLLGDYFLTLFDVMPNCDVAQNPRTIAVSLGGPTVVALDFTCETPQDIAVVRVSGANADIFAVASNQTGDRRITTSPISDVDPAWSPDGSRIAFTSERDGNREIYVMNADSSNAIRLTNSSAADDRPAWSPDGTRIAFVSSRDGSADIYLMNADGTNPVRLTNNNAYDADPTWSPDGNRIAFSSDRDGTSAIWVMNADGSASTRLTSNVYPRGDRQPAWSPDGTRIAFSRTSPTNSDIYVMKPDGTGILKITNGIDNAADPAWSPDGHKIALGSELGYCGWYDYDCGPVVRVVSADGGQYYSVLTDGANPAWRP